MASPDGRALAANTVPGRNPRRRQRNDSTEALTLQSQPQRKRSKFSDDMFEDPALLVHAHSRGGRAALLDADVPRHSVEIPTRAKPPKRFGSRHDDQSMLARTPNYSVKLIPSLPEQLRSTPFRGSVPASARLALAITHTSAYIWDRTSTAASPATRKFDLHHPSKPGDPLPCGALVAPGSAHETGLVVVSSTTGKISFWENVENADALSLFEKRRNGLEGSVGSMFSGETLIRMESADHAGFILIFSSGRAAQLLLRDAQSKPAIAVKFLRDGPPPAKTGFLGGLTNALSGGNWLKNVVAGRARVSSARGQMDLLLANADARFQLWHLGWSGHCNFVREIDVHRQLNKDITHALGDDVESALTLKLVDFAFAGDEHFHMFALIEVTSSSSLHFVLADLFLGEDSIEIRRILTLRSYAPVLLTEKHARPTVIVSESSQTAFIVFEKALVIASLVTFDSSPALQLATDTDLVPEPFEETLYLRDNEELCFVGADGDKSGDYSGYAVASLFVKSQGMVRVVVPEPEENHIAVQRHRISAKSRIEQSVYYGTKPNNPFNLAKSSTLQFTIAEVEEAAQEISSEILISAGQSSGDSDVDVASHLAERAIRLQNLALHLKHNFPPLSRKVKWLLSFDSEKLAAAQEVWRLYQLQQQNSDAEGKLLTELINMIDDDFNSPLDPSKGETDEVRHWFIKHVNHMDKLIMWVYQSFYELVENEFDDPSPDMLVPLIYQACDMAIGALSAAFKSRSANAWNYNLEHEVMKGGLLQDSYEGLPEFWTSRFSIMERLQELVENSRVLVVTCVAAQGETAMLVAHIADQNSRLIDLVCQCWEERCRWQCVSEVENTRKLAADMESVYATKRLEMITKLHDIHMIDEAFRLGEKYRDMDALVCLLRLGEGDAKRLPDHHRRSQMAKLGALERRWLAQFGKNWTDTLFTSLLKEEHYGQLLNLAKSTRRELTSFLREDGSRKKISWLNDILSERDYAHSAETLLEVAEGGGQSNWSQRVELSLAKLSLLATAEAAAEAGGAVPDTDAVLSKCDKELSISRVRQRIYDMLHATTYQALDEQAEVTLVMEAYGASREGTALGELLKSAIEALMQGPGPDVEQLLDLLTLIDRRPGDKSDSPDLTEEVYVLALEALRSCDLDPDSERYKLLAATTWRRIFNVDDWHALNNTERKSDQAIAEELATTDLFRVFYQGFKKSWWQGPVESSTPTPGEVLGSGSTIEGLESRFSDDTIRRHVAKEVKREDNVLQKHIEQDRLEHWVLTTKKLAAEQVEGEAEDQKQEEAATREAALSERAQSTAASKSRGRKEAKAEA